MSYDIQLCCDMADAFLNIGHIANEHDRAAQKTSLLFKSDAYYAIPAVVNLAFACELFLKALIMRTKSVEGVKGHYLDDLFCKLDTDTQERVSIAFSAKSQLYVTLPETLKIHSKAFENWRYAFEPNNNGVEAYPENLQLAALVLRDELYRTN